MRRDLLHPGVLDATLLSEEQDLVAEPLVLFLEPDALVEVVGRPAPGVGDGGPRKGDRLDDSRPDAAGPSLGKGNVMVTWEGGHGRLLHKLKQVGSPTRLCGFARGRAR